jgi:hypothetical protein
MGVEGQSHVCGIIGGLKLMKHHLLEALTNALIATLIIDERRN